MYIVFIEENSAGDRAPLHTARTLEQAFAQITFRCGYSYRFETAHPDLGWRLTIIDVEHAERSPDPIHSTCIKPRDAQYDLMSKAVDGRLKGHVAMNVDAYRRAYGMRNTPGARAVANGL